MSQDIGSFLTYHSSWLVRLNRPAIFFEVDGKHKIPQAFLLIPLGALLKLGLLLLLIDYLDHLRISISASLLLLIYLLEVVGGFVIIEIVI